MGAFNFQFLLTGLFVLVVVTVSRGKPASGTIANTTIQNTTLTSVNGMDSWNTKNETNSKAKIKEGHIMKSLFNIGLGQLTDFAHDTKLIRDLEANGTTNLEDIFHNVTTYQKYRPSFNTGLVLAALLVSNKNIYRKINGNGESRHGGGGNMRGGHPKNSHGWHSPFGKAKPAVTSNTGGIGNIGKTSTSNTGFNVPNTGGWGSPFGQTGIKISGSSSSGSSSTGGSKSGSSGRYGGKKTGGIRGKGGGKSGGGRGGGGRGKG